MALLATLSLIARVTLAIVFAMAGASKLADRRGTRQAVVAFGAPERYAWGLALVLPIVELVVAGLLLPATTASVGLVGALVLLVLFSAAIAWNLARGRTPDCHCFGQLHSAPASWKTLVRNCVLAGVAIVGLAVTVAEPEPSAVAWLGELDGAQLVALVVVFAASALFAAGAFAFLSLMRSYGQVLVRLDRVEAALGEAGIDLTAVEEVPELGLEPGTRAPAFSVASVDGGTVTLDSLTATGVPALLLFTSPHCDPCKALVPKVAAWQRDHTGELAVVVVTDGTPDEASSEAAEFELEHVLLDEDRRVYELFQANGTPSAVLIAADGTIGSRVASGAEWIEQLVEHALGGSEEPGLPPGTEAPALELPSLEGDPVPLEALRGRDTLLLFWNPDCGFCRAMHEDVLAFEASANGVTPQLVIVSSGDAESTRAEGFRSLVLLDERFEAGEAFGANGTPMAVLVDAEGRIASDVVAGADAVLALADARSHA